jgi:hypothetical protein
METNMSPTETTPLSEVSAGTAAVVQVNPDTQVARSATTSTPAISKEGDVQRVCYGLPCAKCKTYYAANLCTCPVCKATERVGPVTLNFPKVTTKVSEETPDPAVLEEERERFLREFQAQTLASNMQINATANLKCVKHENHEGGIEAASICQGCYDHIQERVDVLEAALHMDVKEAAQVVYDAVWADPSDPSKTYQNAAQALLTELRKRSGITPMFGPLSPMVD